MNAQLEFLRTKAAPVALSTAIALAFALSASAQAQYSYPGTASSSGHHARISPMRAGGVERGERQTPVSRAGYGRGNPSMQHGEACPPGSRCAHPQTGDGSGPGHPSNAYGAHESYGAAPVQSAREANAVRPVAAGGKASISPIRARAGHGAMNYGPSQTSNANFRNSVTGKSNGPSTNVTGQPTSFTGPDGKQVNMGGTQSFTGPNGKKQSFDQTPDLSGGGYGHQKGSGINNGVTYTTQNGSVTEHASGSAPGMASATGMNMGNGGASGASDGSSKKSGGFFSSLDYLHSDSKSSTPDAGSNSHSTVHTEDPGTYRNDMDPNKTYKVTNPNAHHVTNSDGGKDSADMGPTAGPGEIVSGTGQVVQPGKHKGQDGGGQTGDAGSSNSGGQNAQGHYVAPSGQDASAKPKEKGVLKMDYNGKNGVIDPKQSGVNGGHG